MSDEIKPALTREQWAAAYRDVPGTTGPGYIVREGGEWRYTIRAFTLGGVWIEAPSDADVDVEPEHLPALMALANAARDDSDPGKITRAMVKALNELVEHGIDHQNCGGPWPDAEFDPIAAMARAAVDALAAILPPAPQ